MGRTTSRPMIGQVLGWMGKLSAIDVQEILAEQAVTREKFGQIALSLGMIEPQHVWEAWCSQLALHAERICLDDVGIDADAIDSLAPDVARNAHVVPVRSIGDNLILATPQLLDPDTLAQLSELTGKQIRLVLADPVQIDQALSHYYGHLELAQAAA